MDPETIMPPPPLGASKGYPGQQGDGWEYLAGLEPTIFWFAGWCEDDCVLPPGNSIENTSMFLFLLMRTLCVHLNIRGFREILDFHAATHDKWSRELWKLGQGPSPRGKHRPIGIIELLLF
jgi:hypothetical protein